MFNKIVEPRPPLEVDGTQGDNTSNAGNLTKFHTGHPKAEKICNGAIARMGANCKDMIAKQAGKAILKTANKYLCAALILR